MVIVGIIVAVLLCAVIALLAVHLGHLLRAKESLDTFGDDLRSVERSLRGEMTGIRDGLSGGVQQIEETLSGDVRRMQESLSEEVKGFERALGATEQSIGAELERVGEAIREDVKGTGRALGAQVEGVERGVREEFERGREETSRFNAELLEHLGTVVRGSSETTTQAMENIAAALRTFNETQDRKRLVTTVAGSGVALAALAFLVVLVLSLFGVISIGGNGSGGAAGVKVARADGGEVGESAVPVETVAGMPELDLGEAPGSEAWPVEGEGIEDEAPDLSGEDPHVADAPGGDGADESGEVPAPAVTGGVGAPAADEAGEPSRGVSAPTAAMGADERADSVDEPDGSEDEPAPVVVASMDEGSSEVDASPLHEGEVASSIGVDDGAPIDAAPDVEDQSAREGVGEGAKVAEGMDSAHQVVAAEAGEEGGAAADAWSAGEEWWGGETAATDAADAAEVVQEDVEAVTPDETALSTDEDVEEVEVDGGGVVEPAVASDAVGDSDAGESAAADEDDGAFVSELEFAVDSGGDEAASEEEGGEAVASSAWDEVDVVDTSGTEGSDSVDDATEAKPNAQDYAEVTEVTEDDQFDSEAAMDASPRDEVADSSDTDGASEAAVEPAESESSEDVATPREAHLEVAAPEGEESSSAPSEHKVVEKADVAAWVWGGFADAGEEGEAWTIEECGRHFEMLGHLVRGEVSDGVEERLVRLAQARIREELVRSLDVRMKEIQRALVAERSKIGSSVFDDGVVEQRVLGLEDDLASIETKLDDFVEALPRGSRTQWSRDFYDTRRMLTRVTRLASMVAAETQVADAGTR